MRSKTSFLFVIWSMSISKLVHPMVWRETGAIAIPQPGQAGTKQA